MSDTLPDVIAILPGTIPIPPDAGTPRPYHLLRRLCAAAPRVHCVAALSEDRNSWDTFLERSGLAERFASVELHSVSRRTPAHVRTLNLLTGRPPFDLRWKDPAGLQAVNRAARELVRRVSPAIFYCYGIDTLQLVPRDLWGSCVVDCTDAASLLARRRLRYEEGISRIDRLRLRLALPLLKRFEARMFEEVSAVLYNSSDDIAHLAKGHPTAPLVRVIDGCDADYFSPKHVRGVEEEPDLVVFTGNMLYPPNADAAIHLARDLLPRIWKQRPAVRALLIGPEPPERLMRLHDGKRIFVTGFVDDVRPYLQRATVVTSPVRVGTGMKNKLQAGLAMEKAMVVSSITCEGFGDVKDGQHVLIANDAGDFAAAVCSLLEDPARRRALGRRGRELIRTHYTWEAASKVMVDELRRTPPVRY